MKGYIGGGFPELGVPPIEPLRIEQLAMENNAGAVRIKALFSDIVAQGASNYTVKDVRSDVKVNINSAKCFICCRDVDSLI